MEYKTIPETKTEEQIKALGYEIENNQIEQIELELNAHFGLCTVLRIHCDCCELFPYINCGIYLSEILKLLCMCLDVDSRTDDNECIDLLSVKDMPIRIVLDKKYRVVGFGHFMRDRFFITQEIIDKAEENTKRYIEYITKE